MMSISLSGIIVLMGFMVSMFLPITERLFLSPHALFAHQALMFGHQDTPMVRYLQYFYWVHLGDPLYWVIGLIELVTKKYC